MQYDDVAGTITLLLNSVEPASADPANDAGKSSTQYQLTAKVIKIIKLV